jgi:hypothetical protein
MNNELERIRNKVVVAKGNKQNHGETSARIGILRAGI